MRLEVRELSFSFRRREVLHRLSFAVEQGEFLSVLGPNGVGKSTLFRCILGIYPTYTGEIRIGGQPVTAMQPRELARHVAYIPQIHRPTFGYTVRDTVLMGTTRSVSLFARPREAQLRQAQDAMERLGVAHLAQRNFAQLSGGEQQLVLVARAVAQQAEILIMDEPTSALDYGNQLRVLHQVRLLVQAGYTVLLSTHNPQHALSYADRVLALADGGIAALGSAREVLTPALLQTLYGVTVSIEQTPGGRIITPAWQVRGL